MLGAYVPGNFKAEKMCVKADEPEALEFVPDHLKTKKMCEGAVEVSPWQLKYVPDHFKTEKMCDKVVWEDPFSLQFVSDWFVTREELHMWYDDSEYCDGDDDEDNFFKWCDGYKKRKVQKASIKEALSIAWHPSGQWNWCVPEDEKKETEKLWK